MGKRWKTRSERDTHIGTKRTMRMDARSYETVSEPIHDPDPVCPICGEKCEVFFLNEIKDVCGCEHCVRRVKARDYEKAVSVGWR